MIFAPLGQNRSAGLRPAAALPGRTRSLSSHGLRLTEPRSNRIHPVAGLGIFFLINFYKDSTPPELLQPGF